MQRQREIEIICANAILKLVSERYAPGTRGRVLQFLADKGAVSGIIQNYNADPSLERTCLSYWDAKLEPDALRLEDLVSALLISFATSFAAALLIEAGKAGFPALYRRIVKSGSVDAVLKELSALEERRREHLQVLLKLLNHKAEAIKSADHDMQNAIASIRRHLLQGNTLDNLDEVFPLPLGEVDLTPIETVVRGTLLTEEQRDSGVEISSYSSSMTQLKGLPLSHYFGVGLILHSKISEIEESGLFNSAYQDIDEFSKDVRGPLRDTHKSTYLSKALGRPPKKVIPVGDDDLGDLLDNPAGFNQIRPLIGALVVRYGGMTSHTAVLSRSIGIACIQLDGESFLKLKEFEFGVIQGGTGLLYQTLPDEFHRYL